ncbi:MAG: glycosyltransferase family 2 protein [Leptolyngbyaceae cyanobacterium]
MSPQSAAAAPLLSICIPAYNRPIWLKRALLSILTTASQQQPNIEIVVSDDSTIPDCKHAVDELITDWQGPYRYYQNIPSLGMAGNWNHCIQVASGDYILILHDDDYLEVGAPNKILQTLQENPNASALLFGVNVVTPQQRVRKRQTAKELQYFTPEAALEQVLTDSSFIRFPGIVLRRKIFQTVGYFDETVGGIADIQTWVSICQEYGLLRIPITTANYTVHSGALTMKMFNLDVIRSLEKIFNEEKIQDLLSKQTLERCKANYFSQFILAGTVRYLRELNFREAREVFNLFDHIELDYKQLSLKWRTVKTILSYVLLFSNPLKLNT